MIRQIPYYLSSKLSEININTTEEIKQLGHLETYMRLKLIYPSMNYPALYDLYCLTHEIIFNELTEHNKQELRQEFKNLLPRYNDLSQDVLNNFLSHAEELAITAGDANEVPIGAIIVYENQIIGSGYNQTRTSNSIFAHAEILAIKSAQQYLNNYRLNSCDLYVTIEPCLMCSGAIINSRIRRVIFGAFEPKTGACCSQYQVFNNKKINHHCQVIGPVNQNRYSQIMTDFYRMNNHS